MRKRILRLSGLLICLSLLAGCVCKHTWIEADCVTARTCPACGETEGEPLGHSWTDASCETPKTCTVCSAAEGQPLGHSWTDASCEAPKTCAVCSATEGEPLSHSEAQRDCAINYTSLTMERETYCTRCDLVFSTEEITLDTLHDGTGFLFDSHSFWERYALIDEQFTFTFLNDVANEVPEETTEDTLTLECRDRFGYVLKVRFCFEDLTEADGEHTSPRCARIVVDPAVSGELGEPDPGGLLDTAITPEEKEYAEQMRDMAHTVALNELMLRHLMVAFMTIDPKLDPVYIYDDDGVIPLVLGAINLLEGKNPELLGALELVDGEKPGFTLNGIYYYANENDELVIEVAS